MQEKVEYIEFEFSEKSKFEDFAVVFQAISKARNNKEKKANQSWLNLFPDYALAHFYFRANELNPSCTTSKNKESTWSFYALIELLTRDMEVEYLKCMQTEEGRGRLEFDAFSYPYGGITGLTVLLNAFDLKATKIDEGGGVYNVTWKNDVDFRLDSIKNATDSSQTGLFNGFKSIFKRSFR